MSKGNVIIYASRRHRPHEVTYPTHDLELVVMIFALKIWRHYLLGERFELYTDRKSLRYLFSQKQLNMRHRRQLEFLAAYDFGIDYTLRKGNKVAEYIRMCY